MSLIKVQLQADLTHVIYRQGESLSSKISLVEFIQQFDQNKHWQIQLLWPIERALVTTVQLPVGKSSNFQKILPFVVEEYISDDIDECFILALDKPVDRKVKVAVINKQLWQGIIAQFDEHEHLRLSSIFVDATLLPLKDEEDINVYVEQDFAMINSRDHGAFKIDQQNLDMFMHKLSNEDKTQNICLMTDTQLSDQQSILTANIENNGNFSLQNAPSISSLTQFLFDAPQTVKGLYREKVEKSIVDHLVPVGLAAAVLVAIMGVSLHIQSFQQEKQVEHFQAQTALLYKDVMGEKSRFRINSFKKVVNEKIAVAGGTSDAGFIMLLSKFSSAYQSLNGIQVNQYKYDQRSKAMKIELESKDLQILSQLESKLEALSLNPKLDKSNKPNGTTLGNLEISLEAN
jgi:general secretion pathway protein L